MPFTLWHSGRLYHHRLPISNSPLIICFIRNKGKIGIFLSLQCTYTIPIHHTIMCAEVRCTLLRNCWISIMIFLVFIHRFKTSLSMFQHCCKLMLLAGGKLSEQVTWIKLTQWQILGLVWSGLCLCNWLYYTELTLSFYPMQESNFV